MKNLILILLFAPIIAFSQGPGGDAAILVPFMKAQDAAKFYQIQQMIETGKNAVKETASLVKTVSSLGSLIEQIEKDARSLKSIDEMRAQLIETAIEGAMDYYERTDALIDFNEVYMNASSGYRGNSGVIDPFKFISLTNGSPILNDIGNSMTKANNITREIEREYYNVQLSAMMHKEEIKQLQAEVRRHFKEAIMINVEIMKSVLGGNNLQGTDNINDKVPFKRSLVQELLKQQQQYMDSASSKQNEIKRLVKSSIDLPEETLVLFENAENLRIQRSLMFKEQLESRSILNNKIN